MDQRCGRCKQEVPLEDFSPSYRGKVGTWCRPCFASYHRAKKAGKAPPQAASHSSLTCDHCGKAYIPVQLRARARFCSRECKNAEWNAMLATELESSKSARACRWCGGVIGPERRSDVVFCETRCQVASRNSTRKAELRAGVPFSGGHLISWVDIGDRDGWLCGVCGDPIDRSLRHPDPLFGSIDHVVPIASGGHPTEFGNLQIAHLECNVEKSRSDRESRTPRSSTSVK